MVFCSTWSSSSSAPPLFWRGGHLKRIDWEAFARLRCFLKHCCHWETESKWTDVWGDRKKVLMAGESRDGSKLRQEWTEQPGSLSSAVLISITHWAASPPLHSSTSIFYHLSVTCCCSLWFWPLSWAEPPESGLSVKAAWAAQEKKLFVFSHRNSFFCLSLLSVFSSSLLSQGSCFKRQRQQIIPAIVSLLSLCFWGFSDQRIRVDLWAVLPE